VLQKLLRKGNYYLTFARVCAIIIRMKAPLLRYFGFSLIVTIAALLGSFFSLGIEAGLVMLVLVLVEITFSFENAVINAKVLQTLSSRWRFVFLTVGILIAIIGMRIIFPILIVVVTAELPWRQVLDLALNNPTLYAEKLTDAHHVIAAFGGSFLLMLCLHFFFDTQKEIHWFERFERKLSGWGRQWLPAIISIAVVLAIAAVPANHHPTETIQAGIFGIFVYVAVRSIEKIFSKLKGDQKVSKAGKKVLQTGWAAFATFIYLEILDASFSFDGVIGAFAITKSVVLIAVGLGVGAIWVRSLTVYMVKQGTLGTYKYLEHGAHYTVGVLAIVLLLSLFVEVPEIIAGLAGIIFVSAAFISSRKAMPANHK
jgi:hypothetical protein